ncbi:NAC domain containing protein 35 [Arabidopsis thaliana]|uniref:Isoform 2 of NAC domain-containing protein 35 n=1 Tax=Arabidopsis thaliana TaxID=3702 RepID=Q9ZVP8-2|nr:NAC domain containing protein 35 [Arabidopsis thaliana]AAN41274.1 putative NAM (no apical meristem) protein [Arabidopsis thaliana]AEC05581.1 NAC domain containing protein 35 [Arabidopsis thaliana]|eukprot:NP_850986.1 NAC domain containing protein 35 [Arabidopsis thaliana]
MAIVSSTTSIIPMSNQVNNNEKGIEDNDHRGGQESHVQNEDEADDHDHDMVMPGFRFHPTEEELIEFYLRRKVEGKRFNVELITFLDLYRYDPWELPAMAAIGEKEWYFYVPRDRKYRNGDRPNRVTTSGYWKATGADRMIRSETSRPIGLKKTLVFYSGKAPKGTRTSWIMNEYRLPHHETEKYQKAEISLCRVYKRPGVEDHPSVPRSLSTRHHNHNSSTSSRLALRQQQHHSSSSNHSDNNLNNNNNINNLEKLSTEYSGDGSTTTTTTNSNSDVTIALANQNIYRPMPYDTSNNTLIVSTRNHQDDDETAIVDDLQRLVNYQISDGATTLMPQTQAALAMNMIPAGTIPNNALWDMWNPIVPDGNRDHYTNIPFK